ncbi:hypothetical protein DSO57_1020227 [Entomophthora muscae]|uniref:Uncharacterized protein n=1 Tax=Entomophthora muscae TaxID=34485 RepID=A0ACC2SSL2_9FUNG|nr:hypothetical protein DSO57_1020227 [Entomophthora muscae]
MVCKKYVRNSPIATPGLADSGSNNGELIKKIVKVEDLKNEVLDREIKKWREAAKNVRQDSALLPKSDDKGESRAKAKHLESVQVTQREANAVKTKAEELKADGNFEEAAEKYKLAVEKFKAAYNSGLAAQMAEAIKEMELKARLAPTVVHLNPPKIAASCGTGSPSALLLVSSSLAVLSTLRLRNKPVTSHPYLVICFYFLFQITFNTM